MAAPIAGGTTPALWLKADALSLSDNDAVSTWADSSGNGRDATAGDAPVYKTNIRNSLPIVRFNGSSDYLNSAYTGEPCTVFVVYTADVLASYRTMLGADTSDAVDVGAYYIQSSATSDSAFARMVSPSDDLSCASGSTSANQWSIWSGRLSIGATSTIRHLRRASLEYGSSDTSTGTVRPITSPVIGCGWYANSRADFFDGDIAEILVYDSVLTDAEYAKVEYYLWNKWGFGAGTPLYLQANFRDFGSGAEEMRLMESADGATWYDRPINYSEVGVRDPSVLVKPGQTRWVVHTSIAVIGTSFVVASSSDGGVTWTKVATVDVSGDISGVTNVWAPEWFYDPAAGLDRVYFAASIDSAVSFKIYETHPTNEARTTWSAAVEVTGTGLPNRIDAHMKYSTGTANGPYFLWLKNETTKYIEIAHSSAPTSGFAMLRTGDWMGIGSGVEGPSVFEIASVYRVYVDRYLAATGIAYTDQATGDWRDGSTTWGALTGITAPFTTRHGTVHPIEVAAASGGSAIFSGLSIGIPRPAFGRWIS